MSQRILSPRHQRYAQQWRPDSFRFTGGQNEVDSETDLKPGTPRAVLNYELTVGGQPRRMDGYQRFDGKIADGFTYFILPFTSGDTDLPGVSGAVYNMDGAATTYSVLEQTITSGTLAGGDAVGVLVIYATITSFGTTGQRIGNSATSQQGALIGSASQGVGARAETTATTGFVPDASYKARMRLALDYARALSGGIQQVPGSGPVRGVCYFNNILVALRDNVGATACQMYRAGTSVGTWVLVPFGEEVSFTAGSIAPVEGAVITQGAVTATLRRICLQSGDWSGGTAAGRFIVTGRAGGNFAAGALTAGGTANLSGAQSAITLLPGGRFEFVVKNFYGSVGTLRLYGCDGVNRAFEWGNTGGAAVTDGVFAPIVTGMPTDTPTHIEGHRDYLFFTYSNGSLQNTGVGNPHSTTVRTGSAEFGLGDTPTALKSLRGAVLAIAGRDSAKLLYGTDSSNWDLKPWMNGTGAVPYCMEEISSQAMALDPRGAYYVEPTQEFGDFADVALTRAVQTTVQAGAAFAKGTLRCRNKSQVRIYFNDRTGVTGTFSATKCLGWMPFRVAHQFTCFTSGENTATGKERLFAGTEDGWVMELDVGTSFDGGDIASSIQFAATDQRLPMHDKAYHMIELEAKSADQVNITLATEIDFGADANQGGTFADVIPASARNSVVRIPVEGKGNCIAPTVTHTDDVDRPFTLQLARVMHTIEGIRRG